MYSIIRIILWIVFAYFIVSFLFGLLMILSFKEKNYEKLKTEIMSYIEQVEPPKRYKTFFTFLFDHPTALIFYISINWGRIFKPRRR